MKMSLRRAFALALIALLAWNFLGAQAAGAETEAADPLARGDRGAAVEALQERLAELGYLSGAADGVYGAQTEAAVRAFQAEAGLPETGIADAGTRAALNAYDAPEAPEERRAQPSGSGEMVWIPNTGKRYHRDSHCSGMKNPSHVSIEEAIRRGFTPCKKCYS